MLGVASGLVAGLVGITPAAGFVSPMGAIAVGAITGLGCYAGCMLKARAGYDDTLDAFGVHGVGGSIGAILTGVFATVALTPGNTGGMLSGNLKLVGIQLVAVGAAAAYAAALTWGILKLTALVTGLRVVGDEEREGLDVVLHGESGYTLGATTLSAVPEPEATPMEARVSEPVTST